MVATITQFAMASSAQVTPSLRRKRPVSLRARRHAICRMQTELGAAQRRLESTLTPDQARLWLKVETLASDIECDRVSLSKMGALTGLRSRRRERAVASHW